MASGWDPVSQDYVRLTIVEMTQLIGILYLTRERR